MGDPDTALAFTGERHVVGAAPDATHVEHIARYAFAARYVQGKRVLDIACGSGYGSSILRDAGALHVDGVDVDEAAVASARATFGRDELQFSVGDIRTFAAAPYDVVVSFETIEHVREYDQALNNLRHLLVDGGTLILSTPNRHVTSIRARRISDAPKNPFHTQEFVLPELLDAVRRAGLDPVADQVYGQRHQRHFRSFPLEALYKVLVRPNVRFSADVTPLRDGREPMIFVLVLRPTGARYTTTAHD